MVQFNTARDINEHLISRIVISMRERNSMSEDVLQILKNFGIEIITTSIYQRTVYTHASLGSSVLNLKNSSAISEMNGLYQDILILLK